MSGLFKWAPLAAVLLLVTPAHASLKDIRTEKLPQVPAVLKAYADAFSVEEYAWQWEQKWPYQFQKETVVARLQEGLTALQQAVAVVPENVELLLLAGLVAHYAHNVDIEGAADAAFEYLARAQQLAPADFRSSWFIGLHQCQVGQITAGMSRLLSIEGSSSWEKLPHSYWDDYLYCAVIAGMPAHALRAGNRARKLKAEPSPNRDFLLEGAEKRFMKPDPATQYPADKVWHAENSQPQPTFSNHMFSISFPVPPQWRVNFSEMKAGTCTVQFETGPYPGKAGEVSPFVLVLLHRPKGGETLDDYANRMLRKVAAKRTSPTACPSEECLFLHGTNPELYKSEGGGHVILTAFERKSPEFPGLLFERPTSIPTEQSPQMRYYRAIEKYRRFEGTLYYIILLDTAGSVLERARSDYESFLRGIRVE